MDIMNSLILLEDVRKEGKAKCPKCEKGYLVPFPKGTNPLIVHSIICDTCNYYMMFTPQSETEEEEDSDE